METKILKVVKCGEMYSVKSEKAEGGSLNKRTLILQEFGGKYENQYAVVALGELAAKQLNEGDVVMASMRFQSKEFNGQAFQDILLTELYKI